MNKKLRLFFAFELEPKIKTRLLTFQHSFGQLDARPVSADNFHITLSFLGNVSERQSQTIIEGIDAFRLAPFEISLGQLTYWPKPAILCMSVEDKANNLLRCKKHIEGQLGALNFFSFDKKRFAPHITLFRDVQSPPDSPIACEGSMVVDHFALFASHSGQHGVNYGLLEQWPLRAKSVKQQLLGDTYRGDGHKG